MVTVIQPPKTSRDSQHNSEHGSRSVDGGGTGSRGGSDRRDGGDEHRLPQSEFDLRTAGYRIGMSLALVGIAMMFAALTIAYLSLVGTVNWRPLALPSLLWLSTALILSSSVTLEATRRAWRGGALLNAQRWLLATVLLGTGFILTQLFCWRHLVAQGVYVASDTHSAFFYFFTGLHALHIIGGIAALCYLLLRVRRELHGAKVKRLPRAAFEASALYWHFVDGLWVYVFMLLLLWQ